MNTPERIDSSDRRRVSLTPLEIANRAASLVNLIPGAIEPTAEDFRVVKKWRDSPDPDKKKYAEFLGQNINNWMKRWRQAAELVQIWDRISGKRNKALLGTSAALLATACNGPNQAIVEPATPTPTIAELRSVTPTATETSQLTNTATVPSTEKPTETVITTATRTKTQTAIPSQTLTSTPLPTVERNLGQTPVSNDQKDRFGISAGYVLAYKSQAELDRYFQELKDVGAGWVRAEFDWGAIQKNGPDSYDWTGMDRAVKTANSYGIKILGLIDYTPKWAQRPDCQGTFACAPADPETFGKFAGEVASRYSQQGIHTWEIWNEPNIATFWKPAPNVDLYVAVLRTAFNSIKKVDSKSVILTGGLAPAGDGEGSISPITFIQKLYNLDPKVFDAVADHPYSYPVLPSYKAPWNAWQQMATLRQIMVKNGDSAKPIWITEFGAPTGGPGIARDPNVTTNFNNGKDYVPEKTQVAMMTDAIKLLDQMKNYVGPFFWYSLIDNGTNTNDPENFFGILRFDGSPKPAWNILKSATGQ